MKSILILFFTATSFISIAQNNSTQEQFAVDFINSLNQPDNSEFKKFYLSSDEFSRYKEKKLMSMINPYNYKKQWANYYNSYNEYVQKNTPNWNKYLSDKNAIYQKLKNKVQNNERLKLKMALIENDHKLHILATTSSKLYAYEVEYKMVNNKIKFTYTGNVKIKSFNLNDRNELFNDFRQSCKSNSENPCAEFKCSVKEY